MICPCCPRVYAVDEQWHEHRKTLELRFQDFDCKLSKSGIQIKPVLLKYTYFYWMHSNQKIILIMPWSGDWQIIIWCHLPYKLRTLVFLLCENRMGAAAAPCHTKWEKLQTTRHAAPRCDVRVALGRWRNEAINAALRDVMASMPEDSPIAISDPTYRKLL